MPSGAMFCKLAKQASWGRGISIATAIGISVTTKDTAKKTAHPIG